MADKIVNVRVQHKHDTEANWKNLKNFTPKLGELIVYDEVYRSLEEDISKETLAQHYNEAIRNAYMGNKLDGIIPCMGIFEFLDKLKQPLEEETKFE